MVHRYQNLNLNLNVSLSLNLSLNPSLNLSLNRIWNLILTLNLNLNLSLTWNLNLNLIWSQNQNPNPNDFLTRFLCQLLVCHRGSDFLRAISLEERSWLVLVCWTCHFWFWVEGRYLKMTKKMKKKRRSDRE